MKKIFIWGLSLIILVGCTDQVQEDIIDYKNNKIYKIIEIEKEALSKYDSLTGDNYKDDLTLYNALQNDIIPKYGSFVEKIEEITPKTEDLRVIHEKYVDAVNMKRNAFILMLEAIENQDRTLIVQANERLTKSRKIIRTVNADLEALSKEHNLVELPN